MSFDTLVLIMIVSMPLFFVLAYWFLGKLVCPRSRAHFFLVCFAVPLICLAFAIWYTNVSAPTPTESQAIADGEMGDPGPLSFAVLFLFGLMPVAIYFPIALLSYWALGKRKKP